MKSFALPLAALAALLLSSSAAVASTVPIEAGRLDDVRDLGPAPAALTVHIAVVLNYRDRAELDGLVDAQADPSSALYHRFLTPSQFRAYFAPTAEQYEHVVAGLTHAGFTVTHTFANRTVLDAAAPAPVAARFFSTEIHRVKAADGSVTYTNTRPGLVPAQIASPTLAVLGLDGVSHWHAGATLASAGLRSATSAEPNTPPIFGPGGSYGPQVFINAYDLPAANGITGTGRATGIAVDADFADSDLAAYLSYFQITRTGPPTVRVPVDGGAPPFPSRDSLEASLDVETIVGLAPGTAVYEYLAPQSLTNANFIDIDNTVVNDNLVDTLNTSYLYCEQRLDRSIPGYPEAVDAVYEQGNALGITFHSSSGDSGSSQRYGCPHRIAVSVPTDTPHNVSIGGTTLSVDRSGEPTSEVGWNDATGATGGGVSLIFPVPSYQRHIKSVLPGGRNLPDLAFDADPLTGGAMYLEGKFSVIGGTSLASPIFGAALTEMDQLMNSRAGHFNVTLYKTWMANGYGSASMLYLRDITLGTIPSYGAGPGYDQMTGIGALQATNFAALLQR